VNARSRKVKKAEEYRALSLRYATGEINTEIRSTAGRKKAKRPNGVSSAKHRESLAGDFVRALNSDPSDSVRIDGVDVKPKHHTVLSPHERAERKSRKIARKLKRAANATLRQKNAWKTVLAKCMRDFPTRCEAFVKPVLARMGFQHQAIVCGYIPDFVHFDKRVIVEIDGSIHSLPDRIEWDKKRDEVLKSRGWKVLHFTNGQVSKQAADVYEVIRLACS
jgi:very-short-patch-repair endonuclease